MKNLKILHCSVLGLNLVVFNVKKEKRKTHWQNLKIVFDKQKFVPFYYSIKKKYKEVMFQKYSDLTM
jgi:hypothetical protein